MMIRIFQAFLYFLFINNQTDAKKKSDNEKKILYAWSNISYLVSESSFSEREKQSYQRNT